MKFTNTLYKYLFKHFKNFRIEKNCLHLLLQPNQINETTKDKSKQFYTPVLTLNSLNYGVNVYNFVGAKFKKFVYFIISL